MIIDIHAHWWPGQHHVHSAQAWELMLGGLGSKFFSQPVDAAEVRATYFDPQAQTLLERMDLAGIDKTVLLPLDWGLVHGEPSTDILAQNEEYARLAQAHPDRFIAFFSIDPARNGAARHFERAVADWGIGGLKLYPPTGFYPFEERLDPFYETCIAADLPVIFHGGPSAMSRQPDCTHPDAFRRLALRFPRLRMVLAHAGGSDWTREALALSREMENVFLDISGWQGRLGANPGQLEEILDLAGGFEKIAFGTDGPIFEGLLGSVDFVALIKKAAMPEKERENLFSRAAMRILGCMA